MTPAANLRDVCRVLTVIFVLWQAVGAQAEQVSLAEPLGDSRPFRNTTEVITQGKVHTTKQDGAKDDLKLDATATFDFVSRRLPAAGRDAQSLREIREFSKAELKTKVSAYETSVILPADRNLIIANGSREGLTSYSLTGPLARDTADLLEIPGDPLALSGTLPPTDVEAGAEWKPADWVIQMLTGMEAVESSELKCKLEQVTPTAAKITFSGKIVGQKLGTNTAINVLGVEVFQREAKYISQAKVVYSIGSGVGAVNPGLETTVNVSVTRTPATDSRSLTDARLQSIPLEPSTADMRLLFEASPWGLRLNHDREWHLFQAIYDGGAPVAIFRMMKQGSLIAQCNVSPVASAAPGQTPPLEKFEADVAQSLGDRLGNVISREKLPSEKGRQIFRLAVSGNVMMKSEGGDRKPLAMNWIYYLVSDANGRQASFVFSVEPALLEQLGTVDREVVSSIEFLAPQQSASRR